MRLQGLVYRAHHPRWAFSPTSGAGAARYGGRFNPVGMQALYTSRRMETAWREAQQGFIFKMQPLTICAYEVDCADIADLTDPATSATLAVNPADLAAPWEALATCKQTPPTWSLAQRLTAAGLAGIVVPCFAPGTVAADRNVVFWRWSNTPPHRVVVIDDEARLPRNESSWA